MKKNTQNGITLVALVITIIVLLILAMVSIKIAIDGGLIQKAKDATDTHTIGAEKEAIAIGYAAYQMDLAKNGSAPLNVAGSSSITPTADGGWDIAFKVNNYHLDDNGNITEKNANVPTEDMKYLKKELEGKAIVDIASITGSEWNIQTIEFNNQNIKFLCRESTDKYYIVYNYSMYTITTSDDEENGKEYNSTHIINVEYVNSYTPKGKEGQKIEYSYDGTEANKKEWTIIYDYGDSVEIISPEAIGKLKLGKEDAEAQGSNDWEKAVYSYNHAIERLNNYAASLITNPNKISVRSVGSNPSNPNYRNTTKYTSETIKNWNCVIYGKYNSSTGKYEEVTPVKVNEIAEAGEKSCEQDLVRMGVLEVTSTGKNYWLASRCVDIIYDYAYFSIDMVITNGNFGKGFDGNSLLQAYSRGDAYTNSYEYAVRPVVKISLNS